MINTFSKNIKTTSTINVALSTYYMYVTFLAEFKSSSDDLKQ